MARNIWHKLIDKGAAATTASFKTDKMYNLMLVVDSVGDAVDSAFTMTVYSSTDAAGTVKTAIGIEPILTGVRDADGAIAFNEVSITAAYEIPGLHPYVYIAITGVTDDILVNLWLGGSEDV